jgi:hypothetical protein
MFGDARSGIPEWLHRGTVRLAGRAAYGMAMQAGMAGR